MPEYLNNGITILNQFIQEVKVKQALVASNNPVFLSLILHFVKKLEIHTYLFNKSFDVHLAKKEGDLRACRPEETERIVNFCHYGTGAPKEWLLGYVSELIAKGEIFLLEKDKNIIGTCEVRKSTSSAKYADIGMIVSPDFRKKGYGTYLLHRAKKIAIEWGKEPICSCEKDNIASLRAIQNCGFVSIHQLLAVTLDKLNG